MLGNRPRWICHRLRVGVACGLACLMLCVPALARPIAAITGPADGATVSGQTWINVAFRTDSQRPIVRVELNFDGRELQAYVLPVALLSGQKSFPIDLTGVAPGLHQLSVRALDQAGETGNSAISINIAPPAPPMTPAPAATQPDLIPPVISVYYPAQGATIAGSIKIRAEVSDDVAVRSVIFYVDGKVHTIRMNSPPFHAEWSTTRLQDGPHVIEARARDAAGNEGIAAPVTVIVQNSAPQPAEVTPPGPAPDVRPPHGGPAPAPWSPVAATGGAASGTGNVPTIPSVRPSPTLATVVPAPVTGVPEPGAVTPPAPGLIAPPSGVKPGPRVPEVAVDVGAGDDDGEGAATNVLPPPLEGSSALPTVGPAPAEIPGTDLTLPAPAKPELAVPEETSVDPTIDTGSLQGSDMRPDLGAGSPGAVAMPIVEDIGAAPEGTLGPDEGAGGVKPPSAEKAKPGSQPTGAGLTRESRPEQPTESRPPTAALVTPDIGAPAPEPVEPIKESPAPPLAAMALAAMGGTTPPAGARTSADGLIKPSVEPYHEGAVAALPGVSLRPQADKPTPVETGAAVVDAPVVVHGGAGAPDNTGGEAKAPTGPKPARAATPGPEDAPDKPAGEADSAPEEPADPESGGTTAVATPPPAPTPSEVAPREPAPATGTAKRPRAGLRRITPGTAAPVTSGATASDDALYAHGLSIADADKLANAQVVLEGKVLPDAARPQVHNGVLMVSLKHIFEAADGTVYWFPDQKMARAVTADADLAVKLGTRRALLNGESQEMPAEPVTQNGTLLAPLEVVAHALGVIFEFEPVSRQVIIRH